MQFDQRNRREYHGAGVAVLAAPPGGPDRFIVSCDSWDDFWDQTKRLASKAEKGAVFERLTQLYLQTAPIYRTELQKRLAIARSSPRRSQTDKSSIPRRRR